MDYGKKIDVYGANADGTWIYLWSTNRYRTCKDAIRAYATDDLKIRARVSIPWGDVSEFSKESEK